MVYLFLTTLPFVVSIVTSAYNLVGDGKSFWEGIFKDVANFVTCRLWIYIHVTTVSTAAEGANGTVSECFCTIGICTVFALCSIPPYCSLYIHLHRLEIEVEEVRIHTWAVFVLCREIQRTDTLV